MEELAGYLSSNEYSSVTSSSLDVKFESKLIPLIDQATYIPLRLTSHERDLLKVLENALEVSDYTDVVDITFSHTHKPKMTRIIESLIDILSISSGLLLATDLTKGETMIKGKTLNENAALFAKLFEVIFRVIFSHPQQEVDRTSFQNYESVQVSEYMYALHCHVILLSHLCFRWKTNVYSNGY